jgi:hypothetical protein
MLPVPPVPGKGARVKLILKLKKPRRLALGKYLNISPSVPKYLGWPIGILNIFITYGYSEFTSYSKRFLHLGLYTSVCIPVFDVFILLYIGRVIIGTFESFKEIAQSLT